MQLYIGDTIKHLRKQKGITQETLAEYMHVSTAAVSKWERNETLPDISMVIPLASYFGVSTDEVLGLDAVKNEEKIKHYLDKANHFAALGKAQERFMKNAPKQQGQAVPQQGQKLTPEQAAQLKKAAEAAQKQADAKKAK